MAKILIQKDICPQCGKEFYCGKSGKCWCYEIDVPASVLDKVNQEYDSCLCPDCLHKLVEERK